MLDTHIAGLLFHLLGKLFQLFDHHAAIRKPERQAGADLIIEDEDFQFPAQLAMVALLGFFQLCKIIFKLLRRFPGRAIDALQHLVLFVAAPVRARDGHQLERILLDLFCAFAHADRGTSP